MRSFTREDLSTLMAPTSGPCVTVCMPTHRRPPESQQDPIRYKNLLKDAIAKLEQGHGKRGDGVAAIVSRLESLGNGGEDGASFWNHQREGLAVFASPDHFSYHCVPEPLREITVVSDSFHVKPLLPVLFDDARYDVLAIQRNEVRLWEGDRDEIHPLPMDGIPENLEDAVGHAWDDQHDDVNFHGFRPKAAKAQGAGGDVHFHGSGGAERSAEAEIERFFRVVDEAVRENVSKKSGLPLLLCAIDDYHSAFRAVSSNPHLDETGIHKDPGSMTPDQIREAAWSVFEPRRRARLDEALANVQEGVGKGTGSNEIEDIGPACVQNRVKVLVIQEKCRVWGRVDRETGAVEVTGEEGAGSADILDDLAEMVLARGGDVVLAPAERMPDGAKAMAAYRF